MEKLKNIVSFYILGTILTFWILALIHLNPVFFYDYFGYSHWMTIYKTTLISGASSGAALWAFSIHKFPTNLFSFNLIVTLFMPYFCDYLIGIVLALYLIAGVEIYIFFFDTKYRCSTYYEIFGFSILLGIPLAIIFCNLKQLKG